MNRWLIILALMLPMAAQAQGEPQFSVELPEGEIIVGQPAVLRLKLLVPTWMPKPPVWPALEVPSLLVRLPERASTPVSETIEGETWSGISRAYRLYPLAVGAFEIPGQTITVTYADPGSPDPIIAELTLDPIRFDAMLPKGAEGLNPPIVASGLTLEQVIEGGPEMATGDAVTRVVTISIQGTTPILLPAMMPELMPDLEQTDGSATPPLRAYPKEPVVTEKEVRGVLSGVRVETTTYVAQAGGEVQLVPIALDWFNLDSGQIETAGLDGYSIAITAPPPPPPGPADYARWVVIGIGGLLLIWGIYRLVWPRLRTAWRKGRTAWRASEPYAYRAVLKALRARDLTATMRALQVWSGFLAPHHGSAMDPLNRELARIGAMKFSRYPAASEPTAWRDAIRSCHSLRAKTREGRKARNSGGILPDLNP